MTAHHRVKFAFLLVAAVLVSVRIFFPISGMWFVAIILLYVGIVSFGVFRLSWGYFHPVKSHGDHSSNNIALTFDDGPIAGKTEQILEILRYHDVPATFFCIGSRVASHPEIVAKISDSGHLIGNHSFSHSPLIDFYSRTSVARELHDTNEMVFEVLGKRPRYFRPPYGITNPMIGRAVKEAKYVMVGWSLRSFDTIITDSSKLYRRTTRALKGGDVILFHDYSDSTLQILPDFLTFVKQKGLNIVPLNELLNEKPYW